MQSSGGPFSAIKSRQKQRIGEASLVDFRYKRCDYEYNRQNYYTLYSISHSHFEVNTIY